CFKARLRMTSAEVTATASTRMTIATKSPVLMARRSVRTSGRRVKVRSEEQEMGNRQLATHRGRNCALPVPGLLAPVSEALRRLGADRLGSLPLLLAQGLRVEELLGGGVAARVGRFFDEGGELGERGAALGSDFARSAPIELLARKIGRGA